GEGGFIPMPEDFPRRLKGLCEEHGILYVDDEVQSGVGRTGPVWAIEHYEVEPDLLVSGKSLGGGLPLAAVTGRAELMDAVPSGGLGGTFGGNPLSCAAAIAVLDVVADPDFLARARELGENLRSRLEGMAKNHEGIGEVRGLGPMLALEFVAREPSRAKAVLSAAFERGLVLLSCGLYCTGLRLLTPLPLAARRARDGEPRRARPAQAVPALRRSAPASRSGAGDRQPAEGAPPGRAARRPRPEAQAAAADRAQADPEGARHDVRLRHAR